jgi:hypothetical protein
VATLQGPVPLPAPIGEHAVEEHRHVFCPIYDACLGRAAHEGWASWTCAYCPSFQRLRRAAVERDIARLVSSGPMPEPHPQDEAGGREVRRSGAGTRAVSSCSRARNDGCRQKGSHVWEEESGLLHMRLEASSVPALFIEAARAVAEVIRGRPLRSSREVAEEISIAAPDPDGLLVAWIGELVRRSVESRVRFEEFDIIYLSDRKLVASIRGVRLDQIQNPLKSTMYHAPALVQCPGPSDSDARARGLTRRGRPMRVGERSVCLVKVRAEQSVHECSSTKRTLSDPAHAPSGGSHDLSR